MALDVLGELLDERARILGVEQNTGHAFQAKLNGGRDHIEVYDFAGPSLLRVGTALDPEPHVETAALAMHHDVQVLPNGNFLTLSVERRWITDYPSSESDYFAPPAPKWVAGETVAGMQPMVGEDWPADLAPHWMIYFAVEDCDATAEQAYALGGRIAHPPTTFARGRFAVLEDPQGGTFSVLTGTTSGP